MIIEKNRFIEQLINEMTLDEKIGQLNQVGTSIYGGKEDEYEQLIRESCIGSILSVKQIQKCNRLQKIAVEETRLGIPLLFAEDVIHGFRTIFPIPLAESCSWNPSLAEESAAIAAAEAASAGIHWTFAPMIDVSRDGRWGRIAESFGEDNLLNERFGVAKITGFQGTREQNAYMSQDKLIACAKHFIGYSAAEGGRDYNTVDMSSYRLANVYLSPFLEAIKAGVPTVMTAFNALNGIPATLNKKTLIDILRNKLNFNGLLVTDWNALHETITHGYSPNEAYAAKKAMDVQVDVDMSSRVYISNLKTLVLNGELEEDQINQAVKRVLELKCDLGLFEQPYRSNEAHALQVCSKKTHRTIARKIAKESIVLLQNENHILPLQLGKENILLIGPFINDKQSMRDTWSCDGRVDDYVTVAQGFAEAGVPQSMSIDDQIYSAFIKNRCLNTTQIEEIRSTNKIIMVLGEKASESGEAKSKASLELEHDQINFLQQIYQLNPHIVIVLMNGRPLALKNVVSCCEGLVEAWHLGVEAGHAIVDVLTGKYNPSGKLTVSFPRTTGQVPLYYNHFNTGRPFSEEKFNTSKYIDESIEPLFPFGYGLSYTHFDYHDLAVMEQDQDTHLISVQITNSGPMAGTEIVQLYSRQLIGSYVRPVNELKCFKRVFLKPQEKQNVTFVIKNKDLSYFDDNLSEIMDHGVFQIRVGKNSRHGLQTQITI
ncbi:MAG: glycoside hydrolase family 3 N-terminal domain-containing protein [Sporolactobacillus sp.]